MIGLFTCLWRKLLLIIYIIHLRRYGCLETKLRDKAFRMKPLNDWAPGRERSLKKRFGAAYLKFNARRCILFSLALLLGVLGFYATPCIAQSNVLYTFTTIAGSPINTNGTDGSGLNAAFNNPQGLAVDSNDVVYVADTGDNEIREIVSEPLDSPTNWYVATISGSTNSGSGNGTNLNARFNGPVSIAIDAGGNLYVSDTGNGTIRELVPSGTNWAVSTIAGTAGTNGAADGTNGDAQFNSPEGITISPNGSVFVADTLNDTIRMLKLVGTNWVVTTIAGSPGIIGTNDGSNSLAHFYNPEGIAANADGDLYVADTTNDIIRKLSLVGTNWVVTTIAGLAQSAGSADGTGNDARFSYPGGIALDTNGNLYVADSGNETIRKLVFSGTNWTVSTIGGVAGIAGYADGTGTNALFTFPKGICVDLYGRLFIDGNTVDEGFTTMGGVALLGLDFAAGDYYWISVKLGPPEAVAQGGEWCLASDPSSYFSAAVGYVRDFDTTSEGLQFTSVPGWADPVCGTIQIPPGFSSEIITDLNYTAISPLLSITNRVGLFLTGTLGTTYRIDYTTNLQYTPWKPLTIPNAAPNPFVLGAGPYLIESWQTLYASNFNQHATFYRAVWMGY